MLPVQNTRKVVAKGGMVTIRVRSHTQGGAVGFGAFGGLGLLQVVITSPLGTVMPVLRGQLAGEVPSLVGGFAFSPLRTFHCDCKRHVVESCAIVTITKLLVLAQHYHVRTKEHFRGLWR